MKEIKKRRMVGWYDPIQLGRTALEVGISTILGHHADKRALEAIADSGELRPKYYYEVSASPDEEFWFDYIADVGDGFKSTYTMAYHLTRPELSLKGTKDPIKEYKTKPGKLLIFGGDEVYPVGDWDTYQERLVGPYSAAFPKKSKAEKMRPENDPLPAVFAIPGNHDWYDSLVAFSALFGREKEFCGWKCEQNRSYFAIKLTHGWWLFGTDMQLGSSLDEAQMQYFETVVKEHLDPTDRIILCNAEPHWIPAALYPKERAFSDRNMSYFEGHILNHQVAIYIAGDRHYYKRHEEISNTLRPVDPKRKMQKIVAGGGGAFLHPTHREKVEEIGVDHKYKLKESYPGWWTSWFLTFWNLLFITRNLMFGLVTGALYAVTSQAFLVDLGPFGFSSLPQALEKVGRSLLMKPAAGFWVLLILISFIFFTETHSKLYRWLGGPVHALAHLFAVLLIAWKAVYMVGGGATLDLFSFWQLLVVGVMVFAGGFLAGPFLMGFYLLVSLNVFGRHHNETFSAIKIRDYKNFIRFRIAENGALKIYPVGVKRIIRGWKEGDKTLGEPALVPKKFAAKNIPFLIEDPIDFANPKGADPPKLSEKGEERVEGPRLIKQIKI